MKSYVAKRVVVRAVQWTGEMTPEMAVFLEGHGPHVTGAQVHFHNAHGVGRFADKGNWLVEVRDKELTVIGDSQFRDAYVEIADEEPSRVSCLTDAEHEEAAQEFLRDLDAVLVDGLRLSQEAHPAIFQGRAGILRKFRDLLENHAYVTARRTTARLREKLSKELL